MKTVGDIKNSVVIKVKEKNTLGSDIYDIAVAVHKEMHAELLLYYTDNRQEIQDSPQFHLKTAEAVELLMQDVDIWINKELGLNGEVIE
jgi:hypothetical protein